jgi:hypothetical protein
MSDPVETGLAFVEKLLGAKSLETVIHIQSDYAKTAYAAFIAQATKMGELHSTLAKSAFKPAEQAIAAMQGMQGTKYGLLLQRHEKAGTAALT